MVTFEAGKARLQLTYNGYDIEEQKFISKDVFAELPEISYRSLVTVMAHRLRAVLSSARYGLHWRDMQNIAQSINHKDIKVRICEVRRNGDWVLFHVKQFNRKGLTWNDKCILFNAVSSSIKFLLKRVDFAEVWGCRYSLEGDWLTVEIPVNYVDSIVSKWGRGP